MRDYERFYEEEVRAGSQDPLNHVSLAQAAAIEGNTQNVVGHLEQYVDMGGRDEMLLRRHILFTKVQTEPPVLALLDRIHRNIAAQRASLKGR